MSKKILIINGSPKRQGNTAILVEWFREGIDSKQTVSVVNAASLKVKFSGCLSCRKCQKNIKYECVIGDQVKNVLKDMASADVLVFATPLYFYGPSAQLKIIIDRMFSLYKWDNSNNTFTSPLKGKAMVLLLTAYENTGLDLVEKSFRLIADYSGMSFSSLVIPDAGESGQIKRLKGVKEKAAALAKRVAAE